MNTRQNITVVFLLFIYGIASASVSLKTLKADQNVTVLGLSGRGDKLYVLDNRKVKWNNARLACASHDMVMAKIVDEQENREVYAFLSGVETSSDVWIAANDIYENGRYVWGTDGNSPVTYFDWITGSAPNDPLCGCISIVRQSSCGQTKCTGWNESVCTETRKTLCMLD